MCNGRGLKCIFPLFCVFFVDLVIMALRIKKFLHSLADLLGFAPLEPSKAPSATYRLDGSVTDEDGNPVAGVRVFSKFVLAEFEFIDQHDTLVTDSEGSFKNTYYNLPMDCVELTFKDDNGAFEPKTVTVSPVQTLKGDSEWYSGEYSATAAVRLSRAQ